MSDVLNGSQIQINESVQKIDMKQKDNNLINNSININHPMEIADNDSGINELKKNEVKTVIKLNENSLEEEEKERTRSSKEAILKREKESKDYERYGVGFDMDHVKVNDADSPRMVELKKALANYLETKSDVLSANAKRIKIKNEINSGIKLIVNEYDDDEVGIGALRDGYRSEAKTASGLSLQGEDAMREAYYRLNDAIQAYMATKVSMFKFGRGKKRLRQVQLVADQLQADNRKFNLSQGRKDLWNPKSVESTLSGAYVIPTYQNAARLQDSIDKREESLNHKDQNHLYHWKWWWTALKNVPNRMGQVYNIAGGTALRAAAIPTMIAANGIELGGKLLKLPLKGLSMLTNGVSKLFGSKKRWNVRMDKHTLTHGWTSFQRARKINLMAIKYTTVYPLALTADLIWELIKGGVNLGRFMAGKMPLQRSYGHNRHHFELTRGINFGIKTYLKRSGKRLHDYFGRGNYYGVEGNNTFDEIANRADADYFNSIQSYTEDDD